jgi:hypothetical protein
MGPSDIQYRAYRVARCIKVEQVMTPEAECVCRICLGGVQPEKIEGPCYKVKAANVTHRDLEGFILSHSLCGCELLQRQ